jgi:hypothetical protein
LKKISLIGPVNLNFVKSTVGNPDAPQWVTPIGVIGVGVEFTAFNFTLVATDPQARPIKYYLTGGEFPYTLELNQDTGEITGDLPSVDNTQIFDFTVTASNGLWSSPRDFTILVDNTYSVPPPIWDTPQGPLGLAKYEGEFFDFSLLAHDDAMRPITFVIRAGSPPTKPNDITEGVFLNPNTGRLAGILPEVINTETYTFAIAITCDFNNYNTQLFTITTKNNLPPYFSTYPVTNEFLENTLVNLEYIALAPEDDQFVTYTANSLPAGATYTASTAYDATLNAVTNSVVITALANAYVELEPGVKIDPNVYKFTVTANDGLKKSSTQGWFRVLKNYPPEWNYPIVNGFVSLGSYLGGVTPSFTLPLATDPNGTNLIYTVHSSTWSPMVFDANTGMVSGTLPATPSQDIDMIMDVEVTDGVHILRANAKVTAWFNTVPTWTANSGVILTKKDTATSSFTVSVTDRETNVFTYHLVSSNAPVNLYTFNAATGAGTIHNSVINTDSESYDFVFTASDGVNVTNTVTYTVIINKDKPPVWQGNIPYNPALGMHILDLGSIFGRTEIRSGEHLINAIDPNGDFVYYYVNNTLVTPGNIGMTAPISQGHTINYYLDPYNDLTNTTVIDYLVLDNGSGMTYVSQNQDLDIKVAKTMNGRFPPWGHKLTSNSSIQYDERAAIPPLQPYDIIVASDGINNSVPLMVTYTALFNTGPKLNPNNVYDFTFNENSTFSNITFNAYDYNTVDAMVNGVQDPTQFDPDQRFWNAQAIVYTGLGMSPGSILSIGDQNHWATTYVFRDKADIIGSVELNMISGEMRGKLPPVTENTTVSFNIGAWDRTWASDSGSQFSLVDDGTHSVTLTILYTGEPEWITPIDLKVLENSIIAPLTFEAGGDNAANMNYTMISGTLPLGLNFNPNPAPGQPAFIDGTTPLQGGSQTYTFTIRADSGATQKDRTFNLVVEENFPPVWQTDADLGSYISNNALPVIQLLATDANGQPPLEYYLDSTTLAGSHLSVSLDGKLTGDLPYTATQTTYSVVVYVTDTVNKTYKTFTLTSLGNQDPELLTPQGQLTRLLENKPVFYQINAVDPEHQTLTFTRTAGSLPNLMTLESNGAITGTTPPHPQPGFDTYTFTVEVEDPDGARDTKTYTLDIVHDEPPVFQNQGNLGTIMSGYNWDSSYGSPLAIDPFGSTIQYAILPGGDGIPPGLSFDTNTGVISGTTDVNSSSDVTYNFTVLASDGVNLPTENYSISVLANHYPEWTTNAGLILEVNERDPINYQLVAYDPDGYTIEYTLDVIASGIAFRGWTVDTNGLITGTGVTVDAFTPGGRPTATPYIEHSAYIRASDGLLYRNRQFSIRSWSNSPPVWLTDHIDQPVESIAYSFQLQTQTVKTNVIYTLESGTLPAGLVLHANGVIDGTPALVNTPTVYSFSVRATLDRDPAAPPATPAYSVKSFSTTVLENLPIWDTGPVLPRGTEDMIYSANVVAHEPNMTTISYSRASGKLPGSLQVQGNGRITGRMPLVTGNETFTFVVRAVITNSGKFTDRTFQITTNENRSPQWVTSDYIGNFGANATMSFTFKATDPDNDVNLGTPFQQQPQGTLQYSLVANALPNGITFNSDFANSGNISGIAPDDSIETTYYFTLGVSDGYIRTDKEFSMKITPQGHPVWYTPPGKIGANTVETGAFSFQFDARDEDYGGIVNYSLDSNYAVLANSLTLYSNGLILGTIPYVSESKSLPLRVIATNNHSKTTSRDFFINADDDPANTDLNTDRIWFMSHADRITDALAANTALLFPGDNLVDFTGNHTLSTSGTVASANVMRSGSGSYNFPGSSWIVTNASATRLNLASNNFTVEAWVYLDGLSNSGGGGVGIASTVLNVGVGGASTDVARWGISFQITGDSTSVPNGLGLHIRETSNGFVVHNSRITGADIPLKTWTHVAWVRNGTTFSYFVNGVLYGTSTFSGAIPFPAGSNGWIGKTNIGTAECFFLGNMNELRVTNGNAVYSSNFTPARLKDATSIRDWSGNDRRGKIVTGMAQASIVSKFGGNSIQISTVSDRFDIFRTHDGFDIASAGAYTVELQLYMTAYPPARRWIVTTGNAQGSGYVYEIFGLFVEGDGRIGGGAPYNGGANAIGPAYPYSQAARSIAPLPLNTWNHIAVTVNGSVLTLWVNGEQQSTVARAGAAGSSQPLTIGGFGPGSGENDRPALPCFIDELRISTISRYSATFIPQTKAYVNPPQWETGGGETISIANESSALVAPVYSNTSATPVNYVVVTGPPGVSNAIVGGNPAQYIGGAMPEYKGSNYSVLLKNYDSNKNPGLSRTVLLKPIKVTNPNMVQSWRFNDTTVSPLVATVGTITLTAMAGTNALVSSTAPNGYTDTVMQCNGLSYLRSNTSTGFSVLASSAFTAELWIKVGVQTATSSPHLFSFGTSNLFRLFQTTGTGNWNAYYNGTVFDLGTFAGLNVWTHFAIVKSGTTMRVYQNGTQIATSSVIDPGSTAFNNIVFAVNNFADFTVSGSTPQNSRETQYRNLNFSSTAKYTSNFVPNWNGV